LWGLIFLESSTQFTYNTGFSSIKSDVLISLSQWQYWWWFWFSFVWCFYLLVINKIVKHKTLKNKPNINTSYRAHGKWGDFLAAIVPTIWCLNILINSNFLLRMMEWQNESSLLTVRIRGRQWYWVYKIDLKAAASLYNTPKNVGKNNWIVYHNNSIVSSKNYNFLLQLRATNNWNKFYWTDLLSKNLKVSSKKINLISDNNIFQKLNNLNLSKQITISFSAILEQFNQNKAVNQLYFLNNKQEKIFNFKNIFFLNFSLKNKTTNLYNYLSNLSNLKNCFK